MKNAAAENRAFPAYVTMLITATRTLNIAKNSSLFMSPCVMYGVKTSVINSLAFSAFLTNAINKENVSLSA